MSAGKTDKVYFWLGLSGVLIGVGILLAVRNRKKAVKFSETLVGQTEIAGNAGFTNAQFEQLMKEVGWRPGDAWCVYFVKLVWYNMAPAFLRTKILRKVTGSTWTTWTNLQNDKNFKISTIPRAGDMAIWRMYKNGQATQDGHAGIVKSLGFGNFTTVEGNTTTTGGNEGYIVAEKTRPINYIETNGLRLLGFIRIA